MLSSPSALADAVSALAPLHPRTNFLPRVAGLSFLEPNGDIVCVASTSSSPLHILRVAQPSDANFSIHFTRDASPEDDDARAALLGPADLFRRAGLWRPEWSRDASSSRIVVAALPHHWVPAVTRALVAHGRAVTFTEPCRTWQVPAPRWLELCAGFEGGGEGEVDPAAVAAAFGLPAGAELGALLPGDAGLVDSTWKYTAPGTVDVIRRSIETRPTAALRLRREGGAGGAGAGAGAGGGGGELELVAWVLVRHDGSMGVLHTLPAHRGKGYARAVVRFAMLTIRRWQLRLSREAEAAAAAAAVGPAAEAAARAARYGALLEPYCHIKIGNEASEKLFEGLGFVPVNDCTWLISGKRAPRFALRPLHPGKPEEWADLLAHINTSYRQDDAFFVDQTRTDMENLRAMAEEGVFYVGYEWEEEVVGKEGEGGKDEWASLDADLPALTATAFPWAVPSTTAAGEGIDGAGVLPATPHPRESRRLVCSIYLKVAEDAGAGAHSSPFRLLPGAGSADGSGGGSGDVAAAPSPPPTTDVAAAAAPAAPAAPSPSPSPSPSKVAHIHMLTIHPSVKKTGVGQRVLDFALATAARTHGCAAVEAFVVSVKPWLAEWYSKNGFVKIGEEPWPAEIKHQLILPCHFNVMRRVL
jgi:GNAT superfamily N-acetyltransferase